MRILQVILWLVVGQILQPVFARSHHVRRELMRSEVMDANGLYLMEWSVEAKEIVFRITVNTRGFIGLGFSYKSNKMTNSDLVLAWIDDRSGKPHILDCHGPSSGNGAPIQDDTQNYVIEEGSQNATHTQIQFRRNLETCDPHDLPLGVSIIKMSQFSTLPWARFSSIVNHHLFHFFPIISKMQG
ncbi:uncharacterized protein DMENIID0001_137340 [Sergentomyia squamirostris]